jgi:hypothetical protein
VADKKPFLLRVDRSLLEQVQRWANDDLRSLNGQIEFLLRDSLKRAGRLKSADVGRMPDDGSEGHTTEESDDAT